MTQDDPKPGKQRRSAGKQSRKSISVYLTLKEWQFLKAASDQLGKTLALMMREYTIEGIERDTDLKLDDFNEKEDED
jgi:predicted DNA-binding protein